MISYEDAAQILALAAARDQRTVGQADVMAWQADLSAADITRQDAEDALVEFYARHTPSLEPGRRFRATTPDIISIARRLRRERLDGFVYEPNPDESPGQYLARLRGQLSAVASGRRPAVPEVDAGPRRDVAALLPGVGREVPAEERPARRPGPGGVACPKCSAPVGRPCRLPSGRPRPGPHPARVEAATGRPGGAGRAERSA